MPVEGGLKWDALGHRTFKGTTGATGGRRYSIERMAEWFRLEGKVPVNIHPDPTIGLRNLTRVRDNFTFIFIVYI